MVELPYNFSFDPTPLNVVSVMSLAPQLLRVVFNKAVVMDTTSKGALKLDNYTSPELDLTAVVQVNDRTVRLTTSPQTPGILYNLEIENVEDLAGNVVTL